MRRLIDIVLGRTQGRSNTPAEARLAIAIRWAAATVFLVFGVGKFINNASEVSSFHSYGLPAPDAFVYAIGALEIGGGLLLAIGLLVRPTAVALAGNMVAAILLSGVGQGETVSLTLAPLLLVGMVYLIRSGAGRLSIDGRLAARAARRASSGT